MTKTRAAIVQCYVFGWLATFQGMSSQEQEIPSVSDILKRASDLALDEENPWPRNWELQNVASVQLKARDFQGALKTIGTLGPKDFNWPLRIEIAEGQAASGDLEGALGIIRQDQRDPQDWGRSRARLAFAMAMARASQFDMALSTLPDLPGKEAKIQILLEVMKGHWQRGQVKAAEVRFMEAMKMAQSEKEPGTQTQMILSIARASQEIGLTEQALLALQAALDSTAKCDSFVRVRMLTEFALVQSAIDREAALNSFATAIGSAKENKADLVGIAIALAKAGFMKQSLDLAKSLSEDPSGVHSNARVDALAAIALAQANAGDTKGATKTLDLLPSKEYANLAALRIVKVHREEGNLDMALGATDLVENPYLRAQAVLDIALAVAKSGDRVKAIAIAQGITFLKVEMGGFDDPEIKIRAFDVLNPKSWAIHIYPHSLTTNAQRSRQMNQMVGLSAAAMRFQQLTHVLKKVDYSKDFGDFDCPILRGLAEAHASTGDVRGALKWAEEMPLGAQLLWALMGVAEGILDAR